MIPVEKNQWKRKLSINEKLSTRLWRVGFRPKVIRWKLFIPNSYFSVSRRDLLWRNKAAGLAVLKIVSEGGYER